MATEQQDTFKKLSKRRVSAPATTSIGPKTQEAPVETLFLHPSVKVVSFTAQVKVSSLDVETSREEAGTAPPRSQTERTIAVGPMRIYRAPGSVAFMSCGSALQPIFPRSQCWCIDESDTTYVLQVRRPTFWRIELPASTVEHQKLASDLRAAWQEVLQFEKTYCPFQRGFSVEIPEKPETPAKKKPWTPKHSPLPLGQRQTQQATERSPSPAEGFTDGELENRDSEQHAPSPLQPEETTKPCSEDQADSENHTLHLRLSEHVSSPIAVASIVDDIHDRYGRISNFEWPSTDASGWITPEGSGRAESPRRQRRHSFDTFMDDTAIEQRQKIFNVDTTIDKLPNESTLGQEEVASKSGTLRAPQTPPNEPLELARQSSTDFHAPGETAESAPSLNKAQPGANHLTGVENLPTEASKAQKPGESKGTPSNIAKEPSQSKDVLLPPATGLRLRVPEATRPTFLKRISSSNSLFDAGRPALEKDRNGLSMNVISKIYDFLLLPMAYVIALLIRASALLIRVSKSGLEKDTRHPEFLQNTEDEFSD